MRSVKSEAKFTIYYSSFISDFKKDEAIRVTHEIGCLDHILNTEEIRYAQRRGETVYQDIWSLKLPII